MHPALIWSTRSSNLQRWIHARAGQYLNLRHRALISILPYSEPEPVGKLPASGCLQLGNSIDATTLAGHGELRLLNLYSGVQEFGSKFDTSESYFCGCTCDLMKDASSLSLQLLLCIHSVWPCKIYEPASSPATRATSATRRCDR